MYEEEWITDYTGRCGNCKAFINDDDRYCRRCGTKRGEGKFEPFRDMMQCIYGPPPVKRVHACTKCKKHWETRAMIDREKFCPDCGAPAKTIEDPRKSIMKPTNEEQNRGNSAKDTIKYDTTPTQKKTLPERLRELFRK